ncbi:alpha-N-arabinofuranosidase [Streptomyces chrestomyceticus JCM 4735]|uniref:Alpha-N-arabinofuranosidase n=1 Tax=Streptomyces chrestomyceticus JCM 4735 TaxID=1306181 RepID=A0A7U9KYJ0_9ACTN|nr:AbfB domain-containing protein [Streptomyces chrestomyceticus]GCD37774.1 alpha-N-arabinofuranosidase [Streptomyces chrestomyceticus JCM 4735]
MNKSNIGPARAGSLRARRLVAHAIVTATALAAVSGMVAPVGAFAAPSDVVSAADVIRTSESDRVGAGRKIEYEVTAEQLGLSDRDFIIMLWGKAMDAGDKWEAVCRAAEKAIASASADDHVRFITTGIGEARELDWQREQEQKSADRMARKLKSQALIAVGIPVNPDLLTLSDDNFIRAIMLHDAASPEVKKAASRALGDKDPAVWRAFIADGAREAHDRDMENERKELEEKDRDEARRRAELDARRSAASLFDLELSEAMKNSGDDDFIRTLFNSIKAEDRSTVLYDATLKALSSSDPADWRTYIHSGAKQARKRDSEIAAEKKAKEDLDKVRTIRADAANTGVHPNLVAAADKALKGSPGDVAAFLREGQGRALRQSLQSGNPKLSGWYLRQSSVDGGNSFLTPVSAKSKETDREDATWVVTKALVKAPGCYSFESVRKPGHYLSLKDSRVRIALNDKSEGFLNGATWCVHVTKAGTTFESKAKAGHMLRQYKGDLYAAVKNGKRAYDTAKDFELDTTWNISTPLAG